MTRRRLPRRLARFGTVRVRTTVGAILVVGLTLLVSSFVLVVMVRRSLTNNVEVAAEFRAESAVALLEGGVSPRQAGMGGDDDTVIQILSRSGQVVAASRQISSRRPLMKLRPEESATVHHVVAGQPDPYRIVARGTKDGRYLVLVGESLEQVRESTAAIVRVLLAIDPVLLVLMTAITWVVTGRALRPVESIRREVAAIGSERRAIRSMMTHPSIPNPVANVSLGAN